MSWRWIALGLALVASPVWAQLTPNCSRIEWEYPHEPRLGFFRVYLGSMIQTEPGRPGPTTYQYACRDFYPPGPGEYPLTLTAVSLDGTEESPHTNTLWITFSLPNALVPILPPAPPPLPPSPASPPPTYDPPPPPKKTTTILLPPPLSCTVNCAWQDRFKP